MHQINQIFTTCDGPIHSYLQAALLVIHKIQGVPTPTNKKCECLCLYETYNRTIKMIKTIVFFEILKRFNWKRVRFNVAQRYILWRGVRQTRHLAIASSLQWSSLEEECGRGDSWFPHVKQCGGCLPPPPGPQEGELPLDPCVRSTPESPSHGCSSSPPANPLDLPTLQAPYDQAQEAPFSSLSWQNNYFQLSLNVLSHIKFASVKSN